MIYRMWGADDHEFIVCNREGYDRFRLLQGKPLADIWQRFPVELVTVDEGRPQRRSDFPWISSSELILRTRALVALRDMLEAGGEILPVVSDGGIPLYVLHVTRIIDAMDWERSTYTPLSDDGMLISDEAIAFHEPLIRDVPFFRLTYRNSPMFVNDTFIQRVREAGLIGLEYSLVWSPEGGPVHMKYW